MILNCSANSLPHNMMCACLCMCDTIAMMMTAYIHFGGKAVLLRWWFFLSPLTYFYSVFGLDDFARHIHYLCSLHVPEFKCKRREYAFCRFSIKFPTLGFSVDSVFGNGYKQLLAIPTFVFTIVCVMWGVHCVCTYVNMVICM